MLWSISGLSFSLDPSSLPPSLHLSGSHLTVIYKGERPPVNKVRRSATSDPWLVTAMPEVCADVVVARGQFYWEVDVCNSSSYRIGESFFFGCLLFPESNSNISQQDCACLSLLSRVNAHADKKKRNAQSSQWHRLHSHEFFEHHGGRRGVRHLCWFMHLIYQSLTDNFIFGQLLCNSSNHEVTFRKMSICKHAPEDFSKT